MKCAGEPSNQNTLRGAALNRDKLDDPLSGLERRPDSGQTFSCEFLQMLITFLKGPTFQDRGTGADFSRTRGHETMRRAHQWMVSMRFP